MNEYSSIKSWSIHAVKEKCRWTKLSVEEIENVYSRMWWTKCLESWRRLVCRHVKQSLKTGRRRYTENYGTPLADTCCQRLELLPQTSVRFFSTHELTKSRAWRSYPPQYSFARPSCLINCIHGAFVAIPVIPNDSREPRILSTLAQCTTLFCTGFRFHTNNELSWLSRTMFHELKNMKWPYGVTLIETYIIDNFSRKTADQYFLESSIFLLINMSASHVIWSHSCLSETSFLALPFLSALTF